MKKISRALVNTLLVIILAGIAGWTIIGASPEELQSVFRFKSTVYVLCLVISALIVFAGENGEQIKTLRSLTEEYRNKVAAMNEDRDLQLEKISILEERQAITTEQGKLYLEKVELYKKHLDDTKKLMDRMEYIYKTRDELTSKEKRLLLDIIQSNTPEERQTAVKAYEEYSITTLVEFDKMISELKSN